MKVRIWSEVFNQYMDASSTGDPYADTELNDINGLRIYEGNYIRMKIKDTMLRQPLIMYYEVRYQHGEFLLRNVETKTSVALIDHYKECEVVGCINTLNIKKLIQ